VGDGPVERALGIEPRYADPGTPIIEKIDERGRDLGEMSCCFLGTLPQFLWFPAQQGQYFSHARDLKFRREADAL
jgi:hypothetical protein